MAHYKCICLAFANEVPAQNATSPKPNDISIYADDLGYGDQGCCGATHMPTHNTDRLEDEGILKNTALNSLKP